MWKCPATMLWGLEFGLSNPQSAAKAQAGTAQSQCKWHQHETATGTTKPQRMERRSESCSSGAAGASQGEVPVSLELSALIRALQASSGIAQTPRNKLPLTPVGCPSENRRDKGEQRRGKLFISPARAALWLRETTPRTAPLSTSSFPQPPRVPSHQTLPEPFQGEIRPTSSFLLIRFSSEYSFWAIFGTLLQSQVT